MVKRTGWDEHQVGKLCHRFATSDFCGCEKQNDVVRIASLPNKAEDLLAVEYRGAKKPQRYTTATRS
jgi:hypothetical protein